MFPGQGRNKSLAAAFPARDNHVGRFTYGKKEETVCPEKPAADDARCRQVGCRSGTENRAQGGHRGGKCCCRGSGPSGYEDSEPRERGPRTAGDPKKERNHSSGSAQAKTLVPAPS